MNKHQHYIQVPPKFRDEKYLSLIEQAFYRMLFVIEPQLEHEQIEDLKTEGITTRIRLSDDGNKNFHDLIKRHSTNKRDTFLFALNHLEQNKQLYCIEGN